MHKTDDDIYRKGQLKQKMLEAAIKAEMRGGGLVNLPVEKPQQQAPSQPAHDVAPS